MKYHSCPTELKLTTLFFGLAIVLTGCSSSYTVSSGGKPNSEYSYGEMIEELRGQQVNIELKDERHILAKELKISNDSASWLDASTSERSKVATPQIKRIVIKNHLVGALEGMGFGFLVGGTAGVILGSSGPESNALGREGMIAIGLVFVGGAGVVVGLIPGVIIGHSYEYEYLTTEQSDSLHNGK
ncbi:MAG: hypothetical protein ACKVRP_12705 [Bacteroidota bacterium]